METRELAVIIAAVITASATLISHIIDENNNPTPPTPEEGKNAENLQLENMQPRINGLTSYEPDPQTAGSDVHWRVAAYDSENDQLFYKYLVNGEDQTDWTMDKTWTWETSKDNIGDNQIDVWIRDAKHADPNSFDDHESVKFTITESSQELVPESEMHTRAEPSTTASESLIPNASPEVLFPNNAPILTDLTSDNASPLRPGETITWTATATDTDSDPLEFKFSMDQNVVQDWSASPTWSWVAKRPGEYHSVEVTVRDNWHEPNGDSSLEAEVWTLTMNELVEIAKTRIARSYS